MPSPPTNLLAADVLFLMLLSATIGAAAVGTLVARDTRAYWQKECIMRGIAKYHPTTGDFELSPVKPETTTTEATGAK